MLRHQAGLVAFIPLYKELLNAKGQPDERFFANTYSDSFSIEVAQNLYLKTVLKDTLYHRILQSTVSKKPTYIYSDLDFIFLGKIVERITGQNLADYVATTFYKPMQLYSIGYIPLHQNNITAIAPTENETIFRQQNIRATVHDPGTALMGGIAGHAGLFSNAYDVAAIMQMLLNGGNFNGKQYLNDTTINRFTTYQSNISRRGWGFDKPEKDNYLEKVPYPCINASSFCFGHLGFTGTAVWADPKNNLVYVFLSNRLQSNTSNVLNSLNVRGVIMNLLY